MDKINGTEELQVEKNLKNRVYEILKNYIVQPGPLPGTRLYEGRLAHEIGVIRTPVRIALERSYPIPRLSRGRKISPATLCSIFNFTEY